MRQAKKTKTPEEATEEFLKRVFAEATDKVLEFHTLDTTERIKVIFSDLVTSAARARYLDVSRKDFFAVVGMAWEEASKNIVNLLPDEHPKGNNPGY